MCVYINNKLPVCVWLYQHCTSCICMFISTIQCVFAHVHVNNTLPVCVRSYQQLASSTLDASAKIYAGRVDAIHSEMYKVLSGLGRGASNSQKPDGEYGIFSKFNLNTITNKLL